MSLLRRALPALAVLPVLVLAAPAAADSVVAVTPGGTNVATYDGVTAWSQYDATTKQYALAVLTHGGTPKIVRAASSPAPLQVSLGPDSKGRVVALYVRCTSAPKNQNDVANGCDAWRYQLSSGQQARLGLSSPSFDEQWPAQWRGQFAFSRRVMAGSGITAARCDVPYRRAVDASTSSRMDRGSCAVTEGLALRGTVVGQTTIGPNHSQIRLLSTGGGPVRVAAATSFGEESNLYGGPALDGTYVYAAHYGLHPQDGFVRIKRSGLALQEVRAHVSLQPAIAIDGQAISYVEDMTTYGGEPCSASGPCRIVRSSSSPFGQARRLLPPELSLAAPATATGYLPATEPVALTARLTRSPVTAGVLGTPEPVAAEPLELLHAPANAASLTATGLTATTGADGRATFTVLPPQLPVVNYVAVTRGADLPTWSGERLVDTQAVLSFTPSATTVASGATVSFAGTIGPPQPGRSDVKIQRRTKHTCRPAGNGQQYCTDEWETIATATVAPGGASYTASAPLTQSGVYTAVLPFVRGNLNAYSGRSLGVSITVAP